MTEPTDLQLIEHYVKLRDIVTTKTKALTDALKPYKTGLETIETALMARLIQRGADNTKTEAGTAYKVEHLNVKVVDREKFLEYAMNGGEDMLLASPQKDAVREYIADKKDPALIGVECTIFTDINVRKS
jgi:hypothetical protein